MRTFSGYFLAACLTGSALQAADSITVHRFSGNLTQPVSGEDPVLRQFEVVLLQSQDQNFFSVLDDPAEGCPWPESFGRLSATDGPDPHLMYPYDDNQYNISLPPLHVALQNPEVGKSWSAGNWTMEITGNQPFNGTPAWQVSARERRGRRQSLVIDAASGVLLNGSQEVFMGQGQRFELTLNRNPSSLLDNAAAERVLSLQAGLLKLQSGLQRRADSQLTELTPRQVTTASETVDALSKLAVDTPLHETLLRIRRDVEQQQQRVAQTQNRRERMLNREAPSFLLNLVSGGTLDSASLKDKIVVLHFWKYAEKPLTEPYGQVGYLEFLYNKRKHNGVAMVGVAMNPALQQASSNRAAQRTARKLIEFMNLSYPVGFDNGSLLRAFGDPRDNGGELPLWVVVSPDGKIVHYQTGFYEVDQRQGLKELDEVLIEQIQQQK